MIIHDRSALHVFSTRTRGEQMGNSHSAWTDLGGGRRQEKFESRVVTKLNKKRIHNLINILFHEHLCVFK